MDKLMELEEKLGYRFHDRQLLRTALTRQQLRQRAARPGHRLQ